MKKSFLLQSFTSKVGKFCVSRWRKYFICLKEQQNQGQFCMVSPAALALITLKHNLENWYLKSFAPAKVFARWFLHIKWQSFTTFVMELFEAVGQQRSSQPHGSSVVRLKIVICYLKSWEKEVLYQMCAIVK